MFFQKKTVVAGFGDGHYAAHKHGFTHPVDVVAKRTFQAVGNIDVRAARMKQEQAVMRKAAIYRSMLTLAAVVQFLGISIWIVAA